MSLILICTALLLLVSAGYILWYQNYSRFYRLIRKIPGPQGYPIIGSTMPYIRNSDDFFYLGHANMKKYYPICKDWFLFTASVNLQHPDDFEMFLSSTDITEKSFVYGFLQPWLGTGLLTSNGTKWQTRRKLLTPAFHFNSLREFIDIFNNETLTLAQQIKEKCHLPAIDVVPLITELTFRTISTTSMGLETDPSSKAFKEYKKAIHDFGVLTVHRFLRPWLHPDFLVKLTPTGFSLNGVVKVLHGFSRKVISEKRRSYKNLTGASYASRKRLAMLDLLLSAQEEGFDIDDEGIREEVDTFMFEGHDTTAVALGYILMLLANNRKVQDEVYKEILEVLGENAPEFNDFNNLIYMERCIKESLRLYPSVPFISRFTKEDVKTPTGYEIPKGTLLTLHIWDLHRNPEIYPDPEKFDPDRFLPEATKNRHPFAFVPFSAGPRNCIGYIGQKYAMLELKAVVCGIIRDFILEPVDTPDAIKLKADLVLRTKDDSLKIQFVPRSKSTDY